MFIGTTCTKYLDGEIYSAVFATSEVDKVNEWEGREGREEGREGREGCK